MKFLEKGIDCMPHISSSLKMSGYERNVNKPSHNCPSRTRLKFEG
jgi:hypothetical protein